MTGIISYNVTLGSFLLCSKNIVVQVVSIKKIIKCKSCSFGGQCLCFFKGNRFCLINNCFVANSKQRRHGNSRGAREQITSKLWWPLFLFVNILCHRFLILSLVD